MSVRHLKYAFIPLFLWSWPAFGTGNLSLRNNCGVGGFSSTLKSAYDPDLSQLRSNWGKKSTTRDFYKSYKEIRLRAGNEPTMAVKSGSLIQKNPSIGAILDDLDTYLLHPQQFELAMKRAGKDVTKVADLRDFYLNQIEIYKSGVSEISDEIAKVNPELGISIKEKIFADTQDGINYLKEESYILKFDDYRSIVGSEYERMRSKLAELSALGSLPRATGYSVLVGETAEMSLAIDAGVEFQKKQMMTYSNYSRYVYNVFPQIMQNEGFVKAVTKKLGRTPTPPQWIDEIAGFIRKKEIDVTYVSADGKTKWLEVKANKDPLSEYRFFDKSHGKSLDGQLREDLEIIKFLRMEGKILMEYYAAGGIATPLQKTLHTMGVQTLE